MSNVKYILAYLNQYSTGVSMGKQYLHSTIGKKNIVLILYIYGARAIFLLLYDHQDTASRLQEMEIDGSGPRYNHGNIIGYM